MVFLANLGVNLHVCLCGDLQVASAQMLDFLDIGRKSSFPDWKLSPTAKLFPDAHELVSIRKWSFDLSDRTGLNAHTLTQSGSTMRTKKRIETYHQMLTILSGDLDLTQRDIAKQMGISLGKTNACLSELIQKKLVKVNPLRIPRNLYRQEDLATKGFLKIDRAEASQTKTNYLYVLTPEGLEEKYRMAQHLYEQKCSDLERLKQQITDLKNEIEQEAPRRSETAT